MTDGLCVECGAPDCGALFDRLLSLEFSRFEPYAALHAVTVSAYGVQHPLRSPHAVREGQWRVLHLFHRRGARAVDALADRRRRRNAAGALGGFVVDVDLPDMPLLPSGSPGSRTIEDVAGDDGKFAAAGHAERVADWVASIVNSDTTR